MNSWFGSTKETSWTEVWDSIFYYLGNTGPIFEDCGTQVAISCFTVGSVYYSSWGLCVKVGRWSGSCYCTSVVVISKTTFMFDSQDLVLNNKIAFASQFLSALLFSDPNPTRGTRGLDSTLTSYVFLRKGSEPTCMNQLISTFGARRFFPSFSAVTIRRIRRNISLVLPTSHPSTPYPTEKPPSIP